jgi:hypothetical protein
MATSKRGRGGRNNNSKGRNQYSGMIGTARANPLSTAAAVGGAVAAGLLLWSRRTQISDEIGNLADRVSGWRLSGFETAHSTSALAENEQHVPRAPRS